jgi:hypothetical protein
MTHRWVLNWKRGAKKARALRSCPHVEYLEARTLLTASLVLVPNPVVAGGSLFGAAAIAHNDKWAVGEFVGWGFVTKTLAEHFNGRSWSVVPTPSLPNGGSLDGLAAATSNDVWAVGGQAGGSGPGSSLIEHWNGSSWSVVSSGAVQNAALLRVTAVSSNDVWAVGNGPTSSACVEHWNGTTWSRVSSPAFTGVHPWRYIGRCQ